MQTLIQKQFLMQTSSENFYDFSRITFDVLGGAWLQCRHHLRKPGCAGGGRRDRGRRGGVPRLGHQVSKIVKYLRYNWDRKCKTK